MKLSKAATFFDRDTVYDAYTGLLLFKAQFSSFDSSGLDGSVQRRRTISLAPGLCLPFRRVVRVHGEKWILGELLKEGFFDEPIRQTSSAKLVTDYFSLLTPGQAALRETVGVVKAYAQCHYLKDTVNTPSDSQYDPQYDVTFGKNETIPVGVFLRSSDKYLHVRSVRRDLEGTITAPSDEIGAAQGGAYDVNCEVDVTFDGAIDPVTELPAAGSVVPGILLEMYKLYNYATEADALNRAGDRTLIVSKTSTMPKAGQSLTIAGVKWRAQTVQSYQDAWNLHIRKA